jgi:hypothetical protein
MRYFISNDGKFVSVLQPLEDFIGSRIIIENKPAPSPRKNKTIRKRKLKRRKSSVKKVIV